MTYVSSQSLTMPIRQSVLQAQATLSKDQTEISTGAPADLGMTLGGQTGSILSMESQIDSLNGYVTSNSAATTRLSATSNVLDTVLSQAQTMSAALITASAAGDTTNTLQTEATSALQTLVGNLNTSVGGQAIFGGINTGSTPLANYLGTSSSSAMTAVSSAFQSFVTSQGGDASSIDGTTMQSFLSGQFSSLFSDSNWSQWSSASNTTMQSTIAPGQTQSTSVSANNSAFRQITQAYTMLSALSGSNLSSSASAAVVSTATTLLNSGIAALTNLQSSVGVAQAAVTSAGTQMSAQVSVLQTNVSNAASVDTYALSTQISTLQTQLEASYELTSQIQSLSLTNYLTAG